MELGTCELLVGLDLGRVIRVVPGSARSDLSPRAAAQLQAVAARQKSVVDSSALYVLDVQAVARAPDEPGVDDPIYLDGVLRGPYPAALHDGVAAIEGRFATTRGALLHGLALGTADAFVVENGACGNRCVHAMLPGGIDTVVMAFPLVPMGDDGTNELVAAQLFHDVLGPLRAELGDDLAADPVPVPDRAQHERELARAGWKIDGDVAVRKDATGIGALFARAKKQRLPRQATALEYVSLATLATGRIPGWPPAEIAQLRRQLGIDAPLAAATIATPRPPATLAAPPPTPQLREVEQRAAAALVNAAARARVPDRPTRRAHRDPPDQWVRVTVKKRDR